MSVTLFPILLPLSAGILMLLCGRMGKKTVIAVTTLATLLTSALVWYLILKGDTSPHVLIRFTSRFQLTLRLDGLGRFFGGLIATLWPLTVLYAFEYMEHEERTRLFFAFFTMAYGVTVGIAMAGNLFTLYVFYELLTLSTVPLVMHTMTREAIRATRTYFFFSLGGAAFAFLSMIYFTMGHGVAQTWRLFYVLGFFGFGVKAAVFPLHLWLPRASVAPTPVTALLHAVAVVKSGVFAIIRLTFCAYGTALLENTWAQYLPMAFVIFTVVYGAVMAVKETHWKRRLAYSTVSNLSYILFSVMLMTKAGLRGGLMHMAFHAEIKILAFFCAGAVLHRTDREYLEDLGGLGRKMPFTFACFTVAALALTGIPPLSGFVSKWYILVAAAEKGTALAFAGAGTVLLAALLTAIYTLTVVRRAFFPAKDDASALALAKEEPRRYEPTWRMLLPMGILAAGIILTGVFSTPILGAVDNVVNTLGNWGGAL